MQESEFLKDFWNVNCHQGIKTSTIRLIIDKNHCTSRETTYLNSLHNINCILRYIGGSYIVYLFLFRRYTRRCSRFKLRSIDRQAGPHVTDIYSMGWTPICKLAWRLYYILSGSSKACSRALILIRLSDYPVGSSLYIYPSVCVCEPLAHCRWRCFYEYMWKREEIILWVW